MLVDFAPLFLFGPCSACPDVLVFAPAPSSPSSSSSFSFSGCGPVANPREVLLHVGACLKNDSYWNCLSFLLRFFPPQGQVYPPLACCFRCLLPVGHEYEKRCSSKLHIIEYILYIQREIKQSFQPFVCLLQL